VRLNILVFPSREHILTQTEIVEVEIRGGRIILPEDTFFCSVINRYEGNDNIALNLVRGFGLQTGALASTVSHDSHNMTIVYDTPENALVAANTLKETGGGLVSVRDGEVIASIPLPVGGLMSRKAAEEVAREIDAMWKANLSLGMSEQDHTVMRIMTLALPVIPYAKMSDMGLVDVMNREIIPLFAQ